MIILGHAASLAATCRYAANRSRVGCVAAIGGARFSVWRGVVARADSEAIGAAIHITSARSAVAKTINDEELWKAYIQLTEAEAAFRIHKSDFGLRPIWHQKEERVLAHILAASWPTFYGKR
jgi:hypothetical protein